MGSYRYRPRGQPRRIVNLFFGNGVAGLGRFEACANPMMDWSDERGAWPEAGWIAIKVKNLSVTGGDMSVYIARRTTVGGNSADDSKSDGLARINELADAAEFVGHTVPISGGASVSSMNVVSGAGIFSSAHFYIEELPSTWQLVCWGDGFGAGETLDPSITESVAYFVPREDSYTL